MSKLWQNSMTEDIIFFNGKFIYTNTAYMFSGYPYAIHPEENLTETCFQLTEKHLAVNWATKAEGFSMVKTTKFLLLLSR